MSTPPFSSAAEAETAFYLALVRADLNSMMQVWSEEENIICIHPDGARLTGLDEIREGWRHRFIHAQQLTIKTQSSVLTSNALLSIHNVLQHFSASTTANEQLDNHERTYYPVTVASNIYSRSPHGWRMIMHHTSTIPLSAPFPSSSGVPPVFH